MDLDVLDGDRQADRIPEAAYPDQRSLEQQIAEYWIIVTSVVGRVGEARLGQRALGDDLRLILHQRPAETLQRRAVEQGAVPVRRLAALAITGENSEVDRGRRDLRPGNELERTTVMGRRPLGTAGADENIDARPVGRLRRCLQ